MRKLTALVILVLLLLCPALADQKADAEKAEATAKAKTLLAQIDGAQYDEAFKSGAKVLQDQVTVTQFADGIEAAKKQVGARSSRSFLSATHHDSLPQAGDGNFYVVKWNSSFKNLPSGHEIMVMSLEEGQWKLAGYGMTP